MDAERFPSKKADNEIYDRLAGSWWDEQGILGILRTAVNPVRSAYFRELLARSPTMRRGARGLDVGCGGGILTEDFARVGYPMVGIDRSRPSLQAARAHAFAERFPLRYVNADAETLPFGDASFDFVSCCDVLEHVPDVGRVLSEIARVLRPGGLFFYDTVNRTLRSNVVAIRFAQRWRWSRFLPAGVHSWHQFVKPRELTALLAARGIEPQELLGMAPKPHPLRIALLALRLHKGKLGYREFGEAIRFGLTSDTSVSYLGWGVRRAPP
jgi:2-polyprenyl-6-hydroxyphenyl methylase / 3-demethylubiquinone-9 3-methyltransferase